jgi:hypothetical protein
MKDGLHPAFGQFDLLRAQLYGEGGQRGYVRVRHVEDLAPQRGEK